MDKQKRKKLKTAAKGYAFIGINLIGVLIFWTVPMLFSFIISISKWDFSKGFKGIKIVGFSNYIEIWRDAWFRASLINNIVFTVSYVVILIVLSFIVAYLLNEYVVGKKFVQLGLYLPYIVNIVAISAVWLALFSNNGPILNLLRKLGMSNPPVFISDLHWALPTIVMICVWQNLGYTVILFLSGMINVSKDLYEAAAIDGANGACPYLVCNDPYAFRNHLFYRHHIGDQLFQGVWTNQPDDPRWTWNGHNHVGIQHLPYSFPVW